MFIMLHLGELMFISMLPLKRCGDNFISHYGKQEMFAFSMVSVKKYEVVVRTTSL